MKTTDTPMSNLVDHLDGRIAYLLSRIKKHDGTDLGMILVSKKNALQEIRGLIVAGHFNY